MSRQTPHVPAEQELLRVDDVARVLSCSPYTVRWLVALGHLDRPLPFAGRMERWSRAQVDRCLERLQQRAFEPPQQQAELAAAGDRVVKETQQSISEWIESTFGPAGSNARVVARANEEMAEILKAVTTQDDHPKLAEELADVVIILYRVATRLGVDLHEQIDRKMAINRARVWKLDGTGHGYHVKPEEAAS